MRAYKARGGRLAISLVVKDLRLKDEDKYKDLKIWSSRILENKDFPRGQQQCWLLYLIK